MVRKGIPRPEGLSIAEGKEREYRKFLEEGIRYEPRQEEANIISRIEKEVEKMMGDLFGWADEALEEFYASVRVPVLDDKGIPVLEEGQFVWEKDDWGRPKEDWSKLNGQDVETAIMVLQRVINKATDEVSRFYAMTMLAEQIQDDAYYEGYRKPVEGTVRDREAAGRRASYDERYHYLYLYWVWKRLSSKLESLKQTKKDLEFARHRYLKDMDLGEQEKRWGKRL